MKTKTEMLLRTVRDYHHQSGRHDMPWRQAEADGRYDPYKILVSEMMLQQTQVSRVIPKYQSFLQKFPTVSVLASAPLSEVLAEWVGLGYNRRAKYLHEAARALQALPEPWTHEALVAQKGIGPNTAAAVLVYSYDVPQLFVETNIRTVVIHHFFSGKQDVTDKEVLTELALMTPWDNTSPHFSSPRLFYWALMDYGTHLKASAGNASRQSRGYARQSRFDGSRRQVRGRIIRALLHGPMSHDELQAAIGDARFDDVLLTLIDEGLVKLSDNMLMLYNE